MLRSAMFRSPPTRSDDVSSSSARRHRLSVSTEPTDHFLEPDLTRPMVIDGQLLLWFSPTRPEQVESGLSTNPTRPDPWTALADALNLVVGGSDEQAKWIKP